MKGIVFLVLYLLGSCDGGLVLVSGYNSAVRAFNFAGGDLASLSTSTATANPSWMAFHPTKNVVYAVDESGTTGLVNSYSLASDGKMTLLNSVSSGGTSPAHISVHPNGNFVFAANYGTGTIVVLKVQNDGTLQSNPVFQENAGGNAHQAITDSTGQYLFVVCKGSNYMVQYKINTDTGVLTRNNPATVTFPAGSGPRHMTFHPNGRFGYLLAELSNRVFVMSYNANTGTFTRVSDVSSLPAGFSGYSTGAEITITNDGGFVFASNRGHNSIASFAVSTADGTLTSNSFTTTNIATPRHFTLDPTNNFVLVANQDSSNVVIFNRNGGALSNPKVVATSANPTFIGFWREQAVTTTSNQPQTTVQTTRVQVTSAQTTRAITTQTSANTQSTSRTQQASSAVQTGTSSQARTTLVATSNSNQTSTVSGSSLDVQSSATIQTIAIALLVAVLN